MSVLRRIPRLLTVSGTNALCRLPITPPFDRSTAVHFKNCERSVTYGVQFPCATRIFASNCDQIFLGNWINPWTFPAVRKIYLDSPITEKLKLNNFQYFIRPPHEVQTHFYVTHRQLGRFHHYFPKGLSVSEIDDFEFRGGLADSELEALEEKMV